jgi:hypothetical protein
MTNYNTVLRQTQYQAVSAKAATYYNETLKGNVLPKIQTDVPDAYQYRHVDFLESDGSHASLDYAEEGPRADTIHEYTDIDLYAQQLFIRFSRNQMIQFGSSLIADKKDAQIKKWAIDVDNAIFHGPKNEQGVQIAEGLIGQLTSMQNLNGTDSNLATKGYIWKAIIKMINGIPFAMREEGPPMILYMTSHLWEKLISPDRVYMEMQEADMIYKNLVSEMARPGFKIGQIIVTDKISAEATDDTDGDNADTVDTAGTHDRMLLIVPDPRWVGVIYSRGFSLLGEDRTINGGLKQNWAWRGRGYFFNTNCAEYTEALVWS